jgi:hypothetical protein
MQAKQAKMDKEFLKLIPLSIREGETTSNPLFKFSPMNGPFTSYPNNSKYECIVRKMTVSILDLVKKHPLRITTAHQLKAFDRATLCQQLFTKPKPRKTSLFNFFASQQKEDIPGLDEAEASDIFSLASKRIFIDCLSDAVASCSPNNNTKLAWVIQYTNILV